MRSMWMFVLVASIVAYAVPAGAVVEVQFPLSKMIGDSETVVVGTITAIRPEVNLLEVKPDLAAKGTSPGELVRVQIVKPAEVLQAAAVGRPLVLFVQAPKGKAPAAAVVHVADTWLMAEAVTTAKVPTYRVGMAYQGKGTFPGRTVALAAAMREMQAGKPGLLEKVVNDGFHGEIKELAKLGVAKPLSLQVVDLNGDKKPDLVIGTAEGFRAFLATADGSYKDATKEWALPGATAGACLAFGDVNGDGKPDCLLNNSILLNTGTGFAATKATVATPGKVRPLAAALMDVTGDGKADALVLSAGGELSISENPGTTDGEWKSAPARALWKDAEAPVTAVFGDWGDTGKPHVMVIWPSKVVRYALDAAGPGGPQAGGGPADFEGLTGTALTKYAKDGLKNVLATALDINGDGRQDLFLFADGLGLMMINRGFGAYLVNAKAGVPLVSGPQNKVPFTLTAATPWAAADVDGDHFDDLLILAEDGTLYLVKNTPRGGAAPAGK
jgi:hypothetical protein